MHPSLVTGNSCHTHDARLDNSCGTVHDACVNSMGTSVHDASVNSGRHVNSDACARTNSCGWAHAHGGGPGPNTLRQCSGNQAGRPAVNNAPHTASVEHYSRRPPKEVQAEAWKGRILTCFRPKTWVETIAEECEVTMSAMTDLLKEPQVPGPGPFQRDPLGWTKKLHGLWLFRGALQGEQALPALMLTGH